MNPAAVIEHHVRVVVRRGAAESASRRKFSFEVGAERRDEFTLTKKALLLLRTLIQREGCRHLRENAEASALWDVMQRVSRECFWIWEVPNLHLQNVPYMLPDIPLCFDSLGLLHLSLSPGQSFLHINCGTGYACTLAAGLVGRNCAVHGVEHKSRQRIKAKTNLLELTRYHPHFRERHSVPTYHACFPPDLLRGRTKFDRVLVTDCFMVFQEIVDLKRFLNPDGRLVTGYLRDSDEEMGMAVVTRTEQEGEEVVIETVSNADWRCDSVTLHPVGRTLREILLVINAKENATTRRLAEALSNPRAPEASVHSLQSLALESCARIADPMGHLLGPLRARLLMRLSRRYDLLPPLSLQLSDVTGELICLRTRCLSIHEDSFDDEDMQGVMDDLGRLVVALEALGQQFLGPQQFALWKRGKALKLSVAQGVMLWLLENVFHVVRFSGIDHTRCCFVAEKSAFDCCFPPDDVLTDEPAHVRLPRPLLDAVLNFFRRADPCALDRQGPWNHQLSPAKRMQRTLTRLAARLCADASGMVSLVRAMKALREEGTTRSDPVLDSNLASCQLLLTQVYHEVRHHSDCFTFNIFQDIFSELARRLMRLHHDACFLLGAGPPSPAFLSLFSCFRLLDSSAARNLVGSGRIRGCPHGTCLEWVNSEGSLLDPTLFEAEREFLSADAVSGDEVFEFLVRRVMSDVKEALWMADGVWADKKLAMFEENVILYYLALLNMFVLDQERVKMLRKIA